MVSPKMNNGSGRSAHAACLLMLLVGTFAGPCDPLPLQEPVTVPDDIPGDGPYITTGQRIVFDGRDYTIAVEPLESSAIRQFFLERSGVELDPFSQPGYLVFRVTVVNKGQADLAFHPVYATIALPEGNTYPASLAELLSDLLPAYTSVDLTRLLDQTVYPSTLMVNPGSFTSRLVVFYSLPANAREFVINFTNVGEAFVDIPFPFRVVERSVWAGQPASPLVVPSSFREQRN